MNLTLTSKEISLISSILQIASSTSDRGLLNRFTRTVEQRKLFSFFFFSGARDRERLPLFLLLLLLFLTQTQSNYNGCVSLRHRRKFNDNRRKPSGSFVEEGEKDYDFGNLFESDSMARLFFIEFSFSTWDFFFSVAFQRKKNQVPDLFVLSSYLLSGRVLENMKQLNKPNNKRSQMKTRKRIKQQK